MIIPFFIPHVGCAHHCVFCDQKYITGRTAPPSPTEIAPHIEASLAARKRAQDIQVAFFGGTFTALPADLQLRYLEPVQSFIQAGRIAGIRISTRPDCISSDILGRLREKHVSTIELGAQSMDDTVLRLSGRGHTSNETRQAMSLIRTFGLRTGIQLMPGLPGDSPVLFRETVRETIAMGPDLVRIYPALVIKDTPLARLLALGQYRPLTLNEAVTTCRDALREFEAAGIEVSRIGLQATEALDRPGTILAGPWHPAFRQLVESSLYQEMMRQLLRNAGKDVRNAVFTVCPRDLSNAIGQKREIVEGLKREFGLQSIMIRGDHSLSGMRRPVRLTERTTAPS